jgi:hypothetical protein
VLWLPRHAQPRSVPDELINDRLLAPLSKRCVAVVQVPQDQSAMQQGTSGMVFGQMEAFAAADLPNPRMHTIIAEALYKALIRAGYD